MPTNGLTDTQSTFIKTFILVPKVFGRSAAKKRRQEAETGFRKFNVNRDAVGGKIDALEDEEVKSLLRQHLAKAEAIIRKDPKNLNFDGGHEQLTAVARAVAAEEQKQRDKLLPPEVLKARKRLTQVRRDLEALTAIHDKAFADTGLPPALKTLCDDVAQKLRNGADAAPEDQPRLATEAETAFGLAKTASDTLLAEKAAWEKADAGFRKVYDVLTGHALANDPKFVKAKTELVTAAYGAAVGKAKNFDYSTAITDLAGVLAQAKTTLAFADDYAGYLATRDERAARVAKLPANTDLSFAEAKTACSKARILLTDADAARDAENVSLALTKVNLIPAAIDDAQIAVKTERNLVGHFNATDDRLTEINALGANVVAEMDGDVKFIRDSLQAARTAAGAGNIKEAMANVSKLYIFADTIKKRGKTIQSFLVENQAFETRRRAVRALKGAGGRVAVEEYYQRLVADRARAKDHVAADEYGMALNAVTAAKGEHAAMIALAAVGARYLVLKKEVTDGIAALESAEPGGGKAAEAIGLTKGLMANAASATLAKDWKGAVKLLEAAKTQLAVGTKAVANAKLIDGIQDADALDDIANDFDTAYGVFTATHTAVASMDDDDTFKTALAAAKTTGDAAKTEAPADMAAARKALDDGIAACQQVMDQISAYNGFKAHSDSLKAVVKGELKPANSDKCVKYEIEQIEAKLKAAEKLAKDPGFDFAGAGAELAECDGLAAQARRNIAAYNSQLKPALKHVKATLKALKVPKIEPGLDTEIAKLESLLQDSENAIVARDLPLALKKVMEGVHQRDPYYELARTYNSAVDWRKKYVTDLIGAQRTRDGCAPEIAEADALITQIDTCFNDHNYALAKGLIGDCYRKIREAGAMADALAAYTPVKTDAAAALKAIKDRDDVENKAAHEKITELEARIAKAKTKEDDRNFSGAAAVLEGFKTDCSAIEPLLDGFEAYAEARDQGLAALAAIDKIKTDAIEPLFARLTGKRDNALKLAAAQDFLNAAALFKELIPDCATAKNTLDGQAAFAKITEAIKDVQEDDTDDLKAAIAAAKATFVNLGQKPSALYIKDEMDAVDRQLTDAENLVEDDFAQAKTLVSAAMDACAKLRAVIGQYDQMDAAAELARHRINTLLKSHAQAHFRKTELEALLGDVDNAIQTVRADHTQRATGQTAIETVISTCRDLHLILNDYGEYVAQRGKIEPDLDKLEKHQNRYAIRDDLTKARDALAEAEIEANKPDHNECLEKLIEARNRAAIAELRAKVCGNEAPDKKEVAALLAQKDGQKQLDDIIASLDASAQRKVMNVAFEARFGCKLDIFASHDDLAKGLKDADLGKKAPNIKRFYEHMSKLPITDTLDNDSMLVFSNVDKVADGSFYSGGKKEVAMREGEAENSGLYGVGLEHEVGKVDADSEPKGDKPVTYFKWNTLHEVGHAVDDKLGYMKSNGKTLAGWEEYGANVTPIAKALATKFDFDEKYIAQYMSMKKGSDPITPDPVGCEPEEWDRRRIEVRIWIDRAREDQKPWKNASTAKDCTIGDRVYQESYPGSWTSYLADARKKGVSGYQFRAPGEWFSELYASFHTDRMNDNHPARTWLEKL